MGEPMKHSQLMLSVLGNSDCPLRIGAQQSRGEVHEEALPPVPPDSNMLEMLSSSLCVFSP